MLSKALVVGAYQKKAEELAALPDVELTVAVPPSWREPGAVEQRARAAYSHAATGWSSCRSGSTAGTMSTSSRQSVGWSRRPGPMCFISTRSRSTSRPPGHAGRGPLWRALLLLQLGQYRSALPAAIRWFERYNFRHATHAIAGAHEAAAILRRHGYGGPISVLPQFGVDPDIFSPYQNQSVEDRGWRIEKDDSQSSIVHLIVNLRRRLPRPAGAAEGFARSDRGAAAAAGHVRVRLIGDGVQKAQLLARAAELGVHERVELVEWTSDVPGELRRLDALVLPSRTTSGWKEQFGRVLPEAMSCGVPVIGSSSGEIPNVIGDAGLIFPEGDVRALAAAIGRLAGDPALRAELGRRGRSRVLERYTQAALARQYYEVYRAMVVE